MTARPIDLNRIGGANEVVLAPAIIGAPPLELGRYAELAVEAGADILHVDVMDGSFAPAITFGHAVVAQLRSRVDIPIDVHLLVSNPELHLARFLDAGADIVTIHIEVVRTPYSTLEAIRNAGARAGIAINPATPLSAIEEMIPFIDLLLVLTVDPGTSKLIPPMINKIRRARTMLDAAGRPDVPVVADGGVKLETIADLASAGARWFVAASAVFGDGPDLAKSIGALRTRAQSAVFHSKCT